MARSHNAAATLHLSLFLHDTHAYARTPSSCIYSIHATIQRNTYASLLIPRTQPYHTQQLLVYTQRSRPILCYLAHAFLYDLLYKSPSPTPTSSPSRPRPVILCLLLPRIFARPAGSKFLSSAPCTIIITSKTLLSLLTLSGARSCALRRAGGRVTGSSRATTHWGWRRG